MINENRPEPPTFTAFLRKTFSSALDSVASFLNGMGLHPNLMTALGLIGNAAAGVFIAMGYLTWGGFLALLAGPMDALDGAMSRQRGDDSIYGAFFDSFTDRYSEIAVFCGLLFHFFSTDNWPNALLVFFAVTGSLMVSYARARAEALHFSAKVGLMTRAERYIILTPGILLRRPDISLWILAILTHFTALQRFWYVHKQARESGPIGGAKQRKDDHE
ncbi:MAG: CDP-alcohol phosphatidyltransferase family protein [Chloroflexota bacterium]|nr:CDP-alcohol phosphatidyltransferase family protein [Chloroflexota bacterium]